jgi:hypothetical protein
VLQLTLDRHTMNERLPNLMNWPSITAPASRHRVSSCMVILATIALSVWCVPSVMANPPSITNSEIRYRVYATRAMIESTNAINFGGLPTEWKGEYSTSCAGPWTETSKGTENASFYVGEAYVSPRFGFVFTSTPVPHWLRGLTPNTSYCARFTAKNADGQATSEPIAFKTLAPAAPEVEKKREGEFKADSGKPQFARLEASPTTAKFGADIEANGSETAYVFEYAPAEAGGGRPAEGSASWKPFTSAATGTIKEDAVVRASLAGLAPETTYYVRLKMSNSSGTSVQTTYTLSNADEVESFTTLTVRPYADSVEGRNPTFASARVAGKVFPHGSETHWRFEYGPSAVGPWTVVPGGEGVISQARIEASPHGYGAEFGVGATLTGLSPAKEYFVRLFDENAAGEGEYCRSEVCEPISVETGGLGIFETTGLPSARTFAIHGLVGEALQLHAEIDSKSSPTSAEQTITLEGAPTGGTFTLTFEGHETGPIAFDAPGIEGEGVGSVGEVLEKMLRSTYGSTANVSVEGAPGGPYTVLFLNSFGGVSEPQIEANGSALTPSGKVTVLTDQKGGEGPEAHYRFEYVSQTSFTEHGWSGAEATPETAAPASSNTEVVSAVLPALIAGETYRYRVVVTSSIPGSGTIEGAEQTLVVPSFTMSPSPSACPNEAFRTGFAAHLPDCRAYEQLSPVEKTGSQEPWQYGASVNSELMVGAEGDNAVLEATTVNWGVGAGEGGSPYLFSREVGRGWGMIAGSPQPETSVDNNFPQVYSANVKQVAFEADYTTSFYGESPNIEYKLGPVGGPYITAATVPREPQPNDQSNEGWVAANGSLSKLVLQTRDRSLLGEPTGTRSGSDLYEYTAQEGLRQLNVSGEPAVTIGSCGAKVVDGADEKVPDGGVSHVVSGPHTVSADGSRVFFEAIPSRDCSRSANLYMRVNGQETADIGQYKFMGANAQGTTLLVETAAGELVSYNVEAKTTVPLSAQEGEEAHELGALGMAFRVEAGEGTEPFAHPRYTYQGETGHRNNGGQVYRYDRVEHLVQCVSCASSFDPAPKQPAFLSSGTGTGVHGGVQELSTTSANGDFAFFTTPAALVPGDVDGEIGIEEGRSGPQGGEYTDVDGTTSPSSDIYEWRAAGVDGCDHVQGCLALITNGRGGFKNLLLRTANEGHDVFIYSRSTLVPQTGRPEGSLGEGNIYNVRVDGGLTPLPPRPTECEGDACSTPPAVPNDSTPSSFTFSGNGNVVSVSPSATTGNSKKAKTKLKKKRKTRKKGKIVRGHKSRSKAKQGSVGASGRAGR